MCLTLQSHLLGFSSQGLGKREVTKEVNAPNTAIPGKREASSMGLRICSPKAWLAISSPRATRTLKEEANFDHHEQSER